MRMFLLALAGGVTLALATPVSAASLSMGWDGLAGGGTPMRMSYQAARPAGPKVSLQDRYDGRMLALQAKMLRLTAEDGGQLTAAHEVSLQRELDDVNRWFGVKPTRG